MNFKRGFHSLRLAAVTLSCLYAAPVAALAEEPLPQAEESDVATLPPSTPHRVVVLEPLGGTAAKIVNGDAGTIQGTLTVPTLGVPAIDPNGKYFYVLETIWSKGVRGVRQDMITVYDAKTLNLEAEIPLPGRLIIQALPANFALSADGKRAFVYNMQPASSMIVVDLERRKVVDTVEIPGCALAFPWRNAGFSSLCGDGAIANIAYDAKGKPQLTRTEPFFDADNDPIFEQSLADPATGAAVFLSYTGKIYQAKLGPTTTVEAPWSLQEAAGMRPAGVAAQDLAWRPGGRQLFAWHHASGKLYVLMHTGNHWTHKQAGAEVWVADLATHKVVKRIELPFEVASIAVSQDDKPLLYLMGEAGGLGVMDAQTGAMRGVHKALGGQLALVPGV